MANTTFDQLPQITNRAPIFFDQKRFVEDLKKRNPIHVFKDALSAAKNHFDNRFLEGEDARSLVTEASQFADVLLWYAWNQYEWDDEICLIAVGGYGRGELHPHSDIDLLILMRKDLSKRYRERIELFVTFLWDIQLKIGHSVRSLSQCVDEAKSDLTVATNLMETRLLCGNAKLLQQMLIKVPRKSGPLRNFIRAKSMSKKHGIASIRIQNITLSPMSKKLPVVCEISS